MVDGLVLSAWRLSQEYWARDRALVPRKRFLEITGAQILIDVGLAEERGDFIYVSGTTDYHEWRIKKQEAGRKGGLKSQENFSSKLKQAQANSSKLNPHLSSPHLISSHLSSPQLNSTQNEENTNTLRPPPRKRERAASKSGPVWDVYREQYATRYGIDPVRNAKVNGQLASLVARLGSEEAPLVAKFYVRSNLAFYVQRQHPVDFLLRDCETLRTQMLTGKQVTNMEARAAENRQQIVNSFGKFLTPEEETNGNPK